MATVLFTSNHFYNLAFALAYTINTQTDEVTHLIQGCVRNERAAQERIYTLFYGRMMALVRRYIDHTEQAEEILNNGFLRAFQKIHKYNFTGSFEGWLRKIVFRSVSDYVRQNVRYTEHTVLEDRDEYVEKSTADRLYYHQLLNLVQELTPATRLVFNLFVMEGFTHREISKMLDISEGTSKWHISEARKELKHKIELLERK